jgi:hypothetical protein
MNTNAEAPGEKERKENRPLFGGPSNQVRTAQFPFVSIRVHSWFN